MLSSYFAISLAVAFAQVAVEPCAIDAEIQNQLQILKDVFPVEDERATGEAVIQHLNDSPNRVCLLRNVIHFAAENLRGEEITIAMGLLRWLEFKSEHMLNALGPFLTENADPSFVETFLPYVDRVEWNDPSADPELVDFSRYVSFLKERNAESHGVLLLIRYMSKTHPDLAYVTLFSIYPEMNSATEILKINPLELPDGPYTSKATHKLGLTDDLDAVEETLAAKSLEAALINGSPPVQFLLSRFLKDYPQLATAAARDWLNQYEPPIEIDVVVVDVLDEI